MLLPTLVLALASVVTPAASASPAPVLKTIVTVKSSPYCNSLAQHFNAAFVPMYANDRTLDHVDTQLVAVDDSFATTDYVQNYVKAREKLGADVKKLDASLNSIQTEINQLRQGEKLTTDPQSAQQLHMAAQELQRAFDKQRAMSYDLHSLLLAMFDYNPGWDNMHHPIGGNDLQTREMPSEMKNIKSYLRFDGQRDIIRDAENKAVDIAYDIATTKCTSDK